MGGRRSNHMSVAHTGAECVLLEVGPISISAVGTESKARVFVDELGLNSGTKGRDSVLVEEGGLGTEDSLE